ncbi:hypothetical protein HHK36_011294 [Tetracentron sinense]|uniref:Uncharacterized protein n=1 Tax=Tetracentron sinense TaxID=13715 RepID=A0A834ZCJ4_TETSI|nr:hypothetical protein HHK36_011294 [Tetracentron sinense]
MAEGEASSENAAIVSKGEDQKKQGPLFAIFSDFVLKFPQLKQETKVEVVAEEPKKTGDEESKTQKLDVVRFSGTRQSIPPLKLEVEESAQGMSPGNMWQVYALGGFMILRWLWARWNERRAKDDSPEEPPQGDD